MVPARPAIASEAEREASYRSSLWAMYGLHFLLAFDFFIIAPTLYLVSPLLCKSEVPPASVLQTLALLARSI